MAIIVRAQGGVKGAEEMVNTIIVIEHIRRIRFPFKQGRQMTSQT